MPLLPLHVPYEEEKKSPTVESEGQCNFHLYVPLLQPHTLPLVLHLYVFLINNSVLRFRLGERNNR